MIREALPAGRRPRILLLAPFLYGDKAAHGGAVLCWAQLRELAQEADLTFLGFSGLEDAEAEEQHRASLATCCVSVRHVPLRIGKLGVLNARWRSLRMHMPELALLCRTAGMEQALRDALREVEPDLVWIQFPQMAHYVECCEGVPAVMDVQDAYTVSAFRKARRHASLRTWLDWMAWARYEARLYPRFKAVLTLSEQDAQVLRAMTPATPARSMGLPLGRVHRDAIAPQPMRVGFAGSFGHHPNLEGLTWFLSEVWPQLRAGLPSVRLVIAGRNPPPELEAAAGSGVEFAGFVPDIFEFYAANTVTVVPLLSGGGVKIKTVEAMLAGSAVVATRIGIEGTEAVDGEHALVADGAGSLAEAIARILQDPPLRARLAGAAQVHAERLFSADAWRARVACLWRHAPPTEVSTGVNGNVG